MNALFRLMLASAVFLTVTSSAYDRDSDSVGPSRDEERKAYERGKKAAEDRKSGANSSGRMTDDEKDNYQEAKDYGVDDAYKKGYRDGQ